MSLLLLLTNPPQVVVTKFLEPGGDATFNVATTTGGGFWLTSFGAATIASDFVHGSHQRSIKLLSTAGGGVQTQVGVCSDSGTRISLYVYIAALPTADDFLFSIQSSSVDILQLFITPSGVLQIKKDLTTQIGSNGSTLSTGTWYRISLAYKITNTTVNRFELFVNGISNISITNATISAVGTDRLLFGSFNSNSTFSTRVSDIYVDNSISLTDPGDIWVTAKRPNANGTTNGFTTQIGAGGSGYGTGHSPQVNERALSTANGWSMVGAGSAVTEQYNIEAKSAGDTDISTGTVIDYMGWLSAQALIAAGANITVNGISTAISLTTAATIFTKTASSTTYPEGTGADIGIITDTTLTTVSLYETGIIVAYIPGSTSSVNNQRFMLIGVG